MIITETIIITITETTITIITTMTITTITKIIDNLLRIYFREADEVCFLVVNKVSSSPVLNWSC
ncbi:uncharacterized protein YjgD (DUF1641 family) [Clostridium beijerinckii]|uniref:hypothetical protein n=1 Tax=Clostridium beijerinckii TaxID=1520 RepID=UPI001494B44D|nr:hypothetical protein [Clostridium beijerinckii]NOW03783.1 uncharacterized protein YjgD (DUF1641 family) [Clostridium beijerinckii]NYC03076.1 uncharacterized protein YjgD (DUF1641 family) [Clostridium beijerinckii]